MTANAQGVVQSNEFSFKLATSGSELYLGGADSALYTGSIEFHPTSLERTFWQLTGAAVVVDGNEVVQGFDTIIDTGTSIMYGPADEVGYFYAAIPGSSLLVGQEGFYTYPCNSLFDVGFTWGGKTWPISSDKYVHGAACCMLHTGLGGVLTVNWPCPSFNLGFTDDGRCVGALAGEDLGLGSQIWVLGDR